MVIIKYSDGKINNVIYKTSEEIKKELNKESKEEEEKDEDLLNKEANEKESDIPFWTK